MRPRRCGICHHLRQVRARAANGRRHVRRHAGATAPEVIDDQKWQETFEVYVQDKHKLGMAQFFEEKSPFAYQDMTARMNETVRKGYWKADEATRKWLLEEYVESVNRHGVGCAENTCGNPRLQKYVLDEGRKFGIPVPKLDAFRQALERATETPIESGARNCPVSRARTTRRWRITCRRCRPPAAPRASSRAT